MNAFGLDDVEEAAEAAKKFAFLENTLFKSRTLTIFGEINKVIFVEPSSPNAFS